MAPHFSLALSRREFLGGMIGAVALNGLPGSAFGLGGIAGKAHPFVAYQFPKDFLWERRRRRIRLRARGTWMGRASQSGTASRTPWDW